MVPPAPVTFSMTTGCPSDCPIRSPTTRALTSVGPPALNGTIMVIGRDGKVCAVALPASVVAIANARNELLRNKLLMFPPMPRVRPAQQQRGRMAALFKLHEQPARAKRTG